MFIFSCSWSKRKPFFPIVSDEIPQDSNQYEKDLPLQRVSVQLPSTARTIESVRITYKNLDGSVKEQEVEIQNSIDWHLPIFITQNFQEQTKKISTQEKKEYKEIATLPFIKFKIEKNKILLETKDKLLRKFLLVNPHRIVCDFSRDTDIRSYIKKISHEDVTEIRVGTHKGYYRVVIELDGSYRYTYTKHHSGYLFTLR